jgi:hypothetical protein
MLIDNTPAGWELEPTDSGRQSAMRPWHRSAVTPETP